MTAWDADGNGCGYTERTKDYPYLYFPTIDFKAAQGATGLSALTEILKFSVCVKNCPDGEPESIVDCYKPSFMIGSPYYSNCTFYAGGTITGSATALRYETSLSAGRYCVPSSQALKDQAMAQFQNEFNKFFGGAGLARYLADIMAAKEVLQLTLLTGFLIGFVYMIVLRLCGGPIIYLSILGMIAGTALGAYMLYEKSLGMADTEQYKLHYLYGSYVVAGISFVLFCCACCNSKNIRIGVAVMKCTAAFLGGNPQVFLVPPMSLAVILAWMVAYLVMAAYIVSVGEIGPRDDFAFLTTVKWN